MIKKINKVGYVKSSGDEYLSGPYPSNPVGKSEWNPEFNWKVSANDYISYAFQVIVEGPKGTHYK